MKLTADQIHEIAQELQTGSKIYINKVTLEVRAIIDLDSNYGETEYWEDELEQILNEWSDFIIIEMMSSQQSFDIMEDFVEQVESRKLKSALYYHLDRKRPFANFKAEIEVSDYRQEWFEFRQKRYEGFVKEHLEAGGIDHE